MNVTIKMLLRFVRNTHPGVLCILTVLALFVALPIFAVFGGLVTTAFQLAGGLVDASGVEDTIPVIIDTFDGEIGG